MLPISVQLYDSKPSLAATCWKASSRKSQPLTRKPLLSIGNFLRCHDIMAWACGHIAGTSASIVGSERMSLHRVMSLRCVAYSYNTPMVCSIAQVHKFIDSFNSGRVNGILVIPLLTPADTHPNPPRRDICVLTTPVRAHMYHTMM